MPSKQITLSKKDLKKLIKTAVKSELEKRLPKPEPATLEGCKKMLEWYFKPVREGIKAEERLNEHFKNAPDGQ